MRTQRLVIGLTVTNLVLLLLLVTQAGRTAAQRRTGTSERPNTTSITMRGAEGQERVIRPELP